MVLEKLLGSESEESEPENGIVWGRFERKYETWHFGPDDEKDVVYDGTEKGVLYRLVDDENDSRRTTSYNREIASNYEVELFAADVDEEWKEKRQENKEMYLVAEGSWDGEDVRYNGPVLVVEKPVFKQLKSKANLAHNRPMNASARHIHREIRNR